MECHLNRNSIFWSLLAITFLLTGTTATNNEHNRPITNSSGFTSTRDKPPYTLPAHRGLDSLRQIYHCGRTINDSRGFIHTPSFPNRFPHPILCQWVLKRPPGKKIVLYFTQFYMRGLFQLTEYDSYTDEQTYQGRHELGTVSFEDQDTSVSVYRPWLVIKFKVGLLICMVRQ